MDAADRKFKQPGNFQLKSLKTFARKCAVTWLSRDRQDITTTQNGLDIAITQTNGHDETNVSSTG